MWEVRKKEVGDRKGDRRLEFTNRQRFGEPNKQMRHPLTLGLLKVTPLNVS